jgi:hypothetical protein
MQKTDFLDFLKATRKKTIAQMTILTDRSKKTILTANKDTIRFSVLSCARRAHGVRLEAGTDAGFPMTTARTTVVNETMPGQVRYHMRVFLGKP